MTLSKRGDVRVTLLTGLERLKERASAFDLARLSDPLVAAECTAVTLTANEARRAAVNAMEKRLVPVRESEATIRAEWAPIINGFTGLEADLKALVARHLADERERILAYQAKARQKAAAAQEQQHAAWEAAKAAPTAAGRKVYEMAAAKAARDEREALEEAPAGPPITGIRTDGGTLFLREDWDWTILDESQVPDEYTVRSVDSDKVRAAIKAGVRSIPGLSIYARTTARTRGKTKRR